MEENRTEELVEETAPAAQEAPVAQEAPAEPAPAQEETAEQKAENAGFNLDVVKGAVLKAWAAVKKFAVKVWNDKLYKMIALGVAAAILLICVFAIVGAATGPKAVAKKYAVAYTYGDVAKIHKLTAYDTYEYMLGEDQDEDEFFESISEYMDEDIESWKDYAKYSKEKTVENLEDEYGDFKLTKEVTKVKDVSVKRLESKFEEMMDSLEDSTDFDRDDIKKAKEVTLKLKISGEDGTDRTTVSVYVVKMGLSWRVLAVD